MNKQEAINKSTQNLSEIRMRKLLSDWHKDGYVTKEQICHAWLNWVFVNILP